MANEILRIYLVATAQTGGSIIPTGVATYIIASAIYVALSAGVAVLWDDPQPIKCFAIGVGLPHIIQSLSRNPVTVNASALLFSVFLNRIA